MSFTITSAECIAIARSGPVVAAFGLAGLALARPLLLRAART